MVDADIQEKPLDCFKTHSGASAYSFAFQNLQLAMARHRLGHLYGLSLGTLAVVDVQPQNLYQATTLLSVEPRIIANELYLRA